jgi:hypothetical protein
MAAMNALRTLASLVATVVAFGLAACGGGGDASTAPAAPVLEPAELLAIGNDMTFQKAYYYDTTWRHDGGMSASDASHDYVHLVAAGLGKKATAENLFEVDDPQNYPEFNAGFTAHLAAVTAAIGPQTIVIVQFGDSQGSQSLPMSEPFQARYLEVLDAAARGAQLVCLSNWVNQTVRDPAMQSACEARGGKFVYIGDVFYMGLDNLSSSPETISVSRWPHDSAMAEIARRVLIALR